jgi:uncharacterized Fe-S cluster-containing radical SAM superfamily protein
MMSSSLRVIDTERFSASLRQRALDPVTRRFRITTFNNSEQARDLTVPPNCGGCGRIHHFRREQGERWPANPLPIDPALRALCLPEVDTIEVQVFQVSVCSWRCWYCFVDFDLLSANPSHSVMLTVEELLDRYLQEPTRCPVIDLSGGQPDLVPEWGLWFADLIHRRGLDKSTYIWSDDNLSNDYLWRYLSVAEVNRLASYRNYGRVGCFKGFDPESFSFNTVAAPELFYRQFDLMRRLVDAGFEVYGYVTLTSALDGNLVGKVKEFVDRLQEIHPLFPLRTVPLQVLEFTPTSQRMRAETTRAMEVQYDAVSAWHEEIERRFSADTRVKKVYEHLLR